jgi:hypothetical protein
MRRSAVTLAVAAVLVTAGCTAAVGKPATTSAPPSATSGTARPSPSAASSGPVTSGPNVRPGEKPPVFPAEAGQHTSEGALMFAGYFVKALDWSLATTDPALLKPISAPTCRSCNAVISGLAKQREKGTYQVGARLTVNSARLVTGQFTLRSDYAVEFNLTEGSTKLVRPSASPSPVSPAKDFTSIVLVSWKANRWLVIERGSPS